MFIVKNLSFSREDKKILEDINIEIKDKSLTSIIGPSGSGKSTILGLLTGRLVPDNGEVSFQGKSIPDMNKDELLEARRKMSIMFQSGALFSDLDVFENVAFPIRELLNPPESEVITRAESILDKLSLLPAKHKMPSELSGGMKYRLAFAKTIATDPEVIMFDEPFVGQDPLIRLTMINYIFDLKKQGKTMILISHDIQEALHVSDYTLFLYEGKIIFQGSPAELRKSDISVIKEFLQGDVLNV